MNAANQTRQPTPGVRFATYLSIAGPAWLRFSLAVRSGHER